MKLLNQIKTSIYNRYFLREDANELYASIRDSEQLCFLLYQEEPRIHPRHYRSIFERLMFLANENKNDELLRYLESHDEEANHSLDFLWESPIGSKERVFLPSLQEQEPEEDLTSQIFTTFFSDKKKTS